ncbi:co-chaperone DjlA [Serratia microhaemolytica]|uniref:co-chaperone DjlA n=1 Tax=Serratia microhaemolytica TaxID=2675110 RepID=UPI000FDEADBA|nr:co-chaperone DjlA [Serratia microhaemolytica]
MQFWGKLLCVIFAISAGVGFWGVLVALIIGQLIDSNVNKRHSATGQQQQVRQEMFFRTTFQVMGLISKSKGRVTEADIEMANHFMDRLRLPERGRLAAQQAFRQGKQPQFPLRATLRELNQVCTGRIDLKLMFLEIQLQAAFADGSLHPKEREVLYVIAEELAISRAQFERYLNMMAAGQQFEYGQQQQGYRSSGGFQQPTRPTLEDACNVLAVNPSDDAITIKRAYRKLMSEHHPDKLVAKGLPPEMMEIAKQKAQAIQAAYDLIKQQRGFR